MTGKDDKEYAENELKNIADDLHWGDYDNFPPQHQCPCCDYVTLPERAEWQICPVCFWEDAGEDIENLDGPCPSNSGMTLRQGRANFQKLGACEEGMVKHVCSKSERKAFALKIRVIK